MMRSDIRIVVCTFWALGTHVQVQALYRTHDSHFGSLNTALGSANASARVGADAYYVADACSEPAQYVIDPAECDNAASALGLSPGILPTMPFGGYCAKWNGGGLGAMSPTSSSWYYYYANNQAGAKSICKAPPAAPAGGPIGAVGDPHLQNVHGERFDVMQPGRHVLINIPRGEPAALLRVVGEASRLGQQCSDMYFQALNVTGAWADAKRAGGYHYRSESVVNETPEWIGFGKVELKVVHGRTEHGARYLNFYVKHLGRTGFAVGGLLGEDDHQDVETPPEECVQRISLLAEVPDPHNDGAAPWVGVASFE